MFEGGRERDGRPRFVTSRRGVILGTVDVAGREAHAGKAYLEGRSAVLELAHQIIRLYSFNDYEKGIYYNVAPISGGRPNGVVAGEARGEFCVAGIPENADFPVIQARLDSMADQVTVEGCRVQVTYRTLFPAMERNAANHSAYLRAAEAAELLGWEPEEIADPAATDGAYLSTYGVPTVDALSAIAEQYPHHGRAGAHPLHPGQDGPVCGDAGPAGITPRKAGKCKRLGKGAPSRSLFRRGQTIPQDAYPARSAHRVWKRFPDRGGSVMAARHVGRRIGTVSSRSSIGRRKGGGGSTPGLRRTGSSGENGETLTPGRAAASDLQLVACGSIFVLLVAVKLLLPGTNGSSEQPSSLRMMEQNIDVQAVFSAVGRAVCSADEDDNALEDVYQAVFRA